MSPAAEFAEFYRVQGDPRAKGERRKPYKASVWAGFFAARLLGFNKPCRAFNLYLRGKVCRLRSVRRQTRCCRRKISFYSLLAARVEERSYGIYAADRREECDTGTGRTRGG
jgi:hypothetical protein